jgi:hypothetical protein
MPKLFCVFVLWAACAVAQTVEGSVIDSITGNGIAGVKVEIVPIPAAARSAPANARLDLQFRVLQSLDDKSTFFTITDALGRFRIPDVPDGNYLARYSQPKYVDETWAPLGTDDPAIRARNKITFPY